MNMVDMTRAFRDPALPIETMLPVRAATVPADVRRQGRRMVLDRAQAQARGFRTRTSWTEVFAPLDTQGGCRFGCKLYARLQGATVRWAVCHSRTYGHSHSPDVR
jgi:hypothetical protein